MKTSKFNITGMTCAACQANVTKAANKLDGTQKADVNLLSNSMTVTFDETKLTEQDFIDAINNIGYGASLYGADNKKSQLKTEWQERKKNIEENISSMKKRLISSIVFPSEFQKLQYSEMFSVFVKRTPSSPYLEPVAPAPQPI